MLTGKYLPGEAAPLGTRATSTRMGETIGSRMDDATLERVRRPSPVADSRGIAIAQIVENPAAADIDLDDEALGQIEALFPA